MPPVARHSATPALRLTKPQHKAAQNKASRNLEGPPLGALARVGVTPNGLRLGPGIRGSAAELLRF